MSSPLISIIRKSKQGHGGLFSKAAWDDLLWNVSDALNFSGEQPLKGFFFVA